MSQEFRHWVNLNNSLGITNIDGLSNFMTVHTFPMDPSFKTNLIFLPPDITKHYYLLQYVNFKKEGTCLFMFVESQKLLPLEPNSVVNNSQLISHKCQND